MDDPLGLRTSKQQTATRAAKARLDSVDERVAGEGLDPQDLAIERMWPLDLSLAVLGGLVIYTIATRLPKDDPNWYSNPWLYAAIVPLGVVGSSLLLRNIASRFVRKSLQFGFLLSVMVHVLLMIAAFNVMIFNEIWSNSTTGVKPVRAPIRKTVPDYLFTRNDMPQKQPDWSRPVDASTTSRTVTPVDAKLPPIEVSEDRLEMPNEQPRVEPVERVFLNAKKLPETAAPTPSSSAGKLARQNLLTTPSVDSAVPVPQLSQPNSADAQAIDRIAQESSSQAQRRSATSALPQFTPMPTPDFAVDATAPSVQLQRRTESGTPQMGSVSVDTELRSRRRPEIDAPPAGAVPATPTIAVARNSQDAERMLSDRLTPLSEPRRDTGAEIRPTFSDEIGSIVPDRASLLDAPRARRDLAMSGLPSIAEGNPDASIERMGRAQRPLELPEGALAGPDVSRLPSRVSRSSESSSGTDASLANGLDRTERVGDGSGSTGNRASQGEGANPTLMSQPSAAMVDLSVPSGPAGLSADPAKRIGFSLAEEMPEIASIDMGQRPRRPAEIGGPPPPAGSKVTGVRPFDRRKLRTAGGATLTPDGTLGAETEEAIERGLAYLAERQNADGSWSLQGHGEKTQMRSDTAATGLCLLAFQGAGYTHQDHQYKETVAKGLKFLTVNQRTNGDLYRVEDKVSDRNAWLYSHGIAALALCEAWGMTRDPNLRFPAQRSIDFISSSQSEPLGGWRYQPGVGSDTSVTGWMMMAMKSAELSGLNVDAKTYEGIERWMDFAQDTGGDGSRYRYNPEAPDTDTQRHGRFVTPTMTAVGLLARLYMGWERSKPELQEGAEYLSKFPPAIGSPRNPRRDTYYWYYATQVMFHMGGQYWQDWNGRLNPILTSSQVRSGPNAGSWEPMYPVPDRWAPFAGRIYVTSMNLLSLEVYYRHLPIYEQTAK